MQRLLIATTLLFLLAMSAILVDEVEVNHMDPALVELISRIGYDEAKVAREDSFRADYHSKKLERNRIMNKLGLRGGGSSADGDSIVFPVLVIGPSGYVRPVTVSSSDHSVVDSLMIQVHNIAYDGVENGSGESKGRYRINAGSWTEISNVTGSCPRQNEREFGCLTIFDVVTLHLPASGVVTGNNTVEFQFRADSTVTFASPGHGYRILDIAWVESDGDYQRDYVTDWTDPDDWTSAGNIALGKAFFEDSVVTGDGMGETTTCISCHTFAGTKRTMPGADLALFNYDPWTIKQVVLDRRVADSSETWMQTNAENVAAWILSLAQDSLPTTFSSQYISDGYNTADAGRPWTKMYQGCGRDIINTDTMAVEFFSMSGGQATNWGLDCVLTADSLMKYEMFHDTGDVINWKSASIHYDSVGNHRRMGTPVQTPSWNFWLSRADPYEIWDGDGGRLDFLSSDFYNHWAVTMPATIAGGNAGAIESDIHDFWRESQDWKSDFNPFDEGNYDPAVSHADNAKLTGAQWLLNRHFSFMFFDKLEELAPTAYAGSSTVPNPRFRGWLGTVNSVVFDMAPHKISGGGRDHIYGPDGEERDAYHDTAWYELQCSLINVGHGSGAQFRPCDWKYFYGHLTGMGNNLPGLQLAYRYFRIYAHGMQVGSNHGASDNWMVRHLSMQRLFQSIGGSKFPWAGYDADTRRELLEAVVRSHMNFVMGKSWTCGTTNEQYDCPQSDLAITSTVNSGEFAGLPNDFSQFESAEATYQALFILEDWGVDATLIDTVAHWMVDEMGWTAAGGERAVTDFYLSGTAPASAPALSSPADAAIDQTTIGTLSWASVADTDTYDYQLDDDSGFSSVVSSGSTASLSVGYSDLAYATTYYWRVRATNSFGSSSYSAARSFTTISDPLTDQDWSTGGARVAGAGSQMMITGQGVLGTLPGNPSLDGFGSFMDFADGDTAFVKVDSLRGSSTSIYKTVALVALDAIDDDAQMFSTELVYNRIRLVTRTTTAGTPQFVETLSYLTDADDVCLRVVRSGTTFRGSYKEGGDCTVDSGYAEFAAGAVNLSAVAGAAKIGIFVSAGDPVGVLDVDAYVKDFIVR